MVLGRVAPPDIDLAGEIRMEFVDRSREDRLFVPRRPEQRVEGDTAINLAGRVARVERVRQWRQQVLGDPCGFANELEHLTAVGLREVVSRKAADQGFGKLAVRQTVEIAADLVDEAEPDLVWHHLIVEDPFLGFGNCHSLGGRVCISTTSTPRLRIFCMKSK